MTAWLKESGLLWGSAEPEQKLWAVKDVLKAPKMAVVRTDWIELFNKYVTQHYGQKINRFLLQVKGSQKWLTEFQCIQFCCPCKRSQFSIHVVCHVIAKLYCLGSPWSGTSCSMIVHIKLVEHRQVAYEPKCFYVSDVLHYMVLCTWVFLGNTTFAN